MGSLGRKQSLLQLQFHRLECGKLWWPRFPFMVGNHRYTRSFAMTALDLQTGRIIHAVKGRSKNDIGPFLKLVAQKAKKLKAVAMDMSRSYSGAVTEYLPQVDIVFDRYHIMAQMNMAIAPLRRQQQNISEQNGQNYLKDSRFLLLRNYKSLNPERQVKLDTLLEINRPLFTIHSMKEQLRLLWDQSNLKRQAYGFRDMEYFKLRFYHLHCQGYSLTG